MSPPPLMPSQQLQMARPTLEDLPAGTIGLPYSLRAFRDGDEPSWAAIMNTGIGQGWTAERCQVELTHRPQFVPDALLFAERDTVVGKTVVGSACAWRRNLDEKVTGYVHMVCVLPGHRGNGLGYWLTLETLRYFRSHAFSRAILNTDDFRLPAIRTYLKLGFVPELIDGSHADRWAIVMANLNGGRVPD